MKKIIFITGSTDGIGKLVAMKFAQEGHKILLHGRSEEKLAKVLNEIEVLAKNEQVKGYVADLSNMDAVRQLAEDVKSENETIDVLINNAGVYSSPETFNEAGLDLRFTVNYFAPYLLTRLLLPLLEKAEKPRVIDLSSAAQSTVSIDALKGGIKLPQGETYAQSKLALTMWNFRAAKENPNVIFIPVNPGSLLNTKMAKEAYGRHWNTAEKGRDILYDLVLSNDFDNASGKYFDNDRGTFGMAHPDAYDESKIDELINATEEILKSLGLRRA